MTTSPSAETRPPFLDKAEKQSPPAQQNSRGKKKKNRVSKHVIQALKDKADVKLQLQKQQQEQQPLANPIASQSTKKKTKEKRIVKDPSEASLYLMTWNKHRAEWKFSKNMQSWLIRHMYESDKINKSTFTLLMEYLKGLQGGSTKTRIVTEATRRALRYKEYEKNSQQESNNVDGQAERENEAGTNSSHRKSNASSETNGGQDDDVRWRALSDHDKRKEYKRARKVLEILRE